MNWMVRIAGEYRDIIFPSLLSGQGGSPGSIQQNIRSPGDSAIHGRWNCRRMVMAATAFLRARFPSPHRVPIGQFFRPPAGDRMPWHGSACRDFAKIYIFL
ncbi:MAG: hypothetical protein APR55_05285 [Methanolinea sp. SDB]|nr:MAG: hypothetical protein APR55_05285 [Methanolinea sp. SDB]